MENRVESVLDQGASLIFTRLLWCIASRSISPPFYLPHMFAALMLCLCLSQSVFAKSNAQNPDQPPATKQQYQAELEKWMLRAYEGDRDAQFRVGALHTNSQFNQPDIEQAVYWYKQAARQGHVLAQYNLGHRYLTGVGVKPSQTTAMSWWLKAAKQDHDLAQFNVGRAYYLGIGFAEDHALSRKWFERAAANNEPQSIDILQQLGWTDADGAPVAADLVDATDLDVTEKATSELGITDLGQTDDANQIAATESGNVAEIKDERFATGGKVENQVNAAPEDLASVITAVDLTPIDSTAESEVKAADNALHDQVNTESASQEPVAQKTEVSATRPIVGKLSMPIDPAFKARQHPVSDSPTVAGQLILIGTGIGSAQESVNLNSIVYSKLAGDHVQINLVTDGSVGEPGSFSTDDPARIALDFFGMKKQLAESRIKIDTGQVASVVAVEASDRTRIIINLFDTARYEVVEAVDGYAVTIYNTGADNTARTQPKPFAKRPDVQKNLEQYRYWVEIGHRLTQWKNAWGAGDIDRYLKLYSDAFVPENHIKLSRWKEQRRARVLPERNIKIELADPEIFCSDDNMHCTVMFEQHYRSKRFADTMDKTLVFRKEGEQWYIVAECGVCG